MFKLVVGVALAFLLVRYWGDLTTYLDGMIRSGDKAQVAAPADGAAEGDRATTAPATTPHEETIHDRLKAMQP